MKKIFTKLMLLAVAAAALVSCENNYYESTPVVELTQTVTLSADKTAVRTELIEGVPYWSKGDAVGVYLEDETKHYKFDNTAEEASLTATFKGETAVANTLFVYYPYTANGVGEKGAKVDIPVNQEPTATSFDGKADIMLAKPVTLDEEGKQVGNLEFARLGAIVKVVLKGKDKDNADKLAGQHVSSLTMATAAAEKAYLTGRVYIDVKNQELGELYYGHSESVTATYTEATQYEVNGTNATYVIVYPQTLAAGSTLSFEAATEGYAISKKITLGEDIVLLPGKVYTLNVSLAADNLVKEETGLALPFKDDFARVAYDASEGGIDLSVLGENYSAMEKVYKAKIGEGGILKLGTGSAEGYFTTTALDLSKPFTVFVAAQRYGTSTSDKLKVTVGSQVKESTALTADLKYYVFEFEAAGKKDVVEIRTVKRAYIDDLQIVADHGLDVPTLPAVLTVSKSEISVSHEAANESFTYSVANPVEGTTATVTDNVDWITTADDNGTVTVTVAANDAEEAREGVVTVTYGDLTKTVTVSQAAKPAEGGEGDVAQYVKVTSTSDITSGTYLIVYESKSYAFNGGLATASIDAAGNYKSVTISNNTIASNATTDAMAFVYDASNKSFKGVGGAYINRTGTSNGMDESASVQSHTSVTISSGNAIITSSGGPNLQFYDSGANSRFRYYATTQKAVQLYKLVGGNGGGSTPEPEPETPVLSINPTTLSFDAAGGNKTVACTIENEVSGQSVTATSSNTSWLTTSVSGKTVTVTATANTGAARNATVTIAYTGAESKTVTVSQAAGESTGGDEVVESDNITITPANIASNSAYATYSNADWIMTFGSNNGSFGSNSSQSSKMKLGDNYVVATPLDASITSTTVNYAAIISKFDLKGISKITLSGTKKTSTMQIGITYSTDGGATWTKLADLGSNTTFTFTAIPSARYAIVLKSNGGDSRYQSFSANFSGN